MRRALVVRAPGARRRAGRARERGEPRLARGPAGALLHGLRHDARRCERGLVHAGGDQLHRGPDRCGRDEERDQEEGRRAVPGPSDRDAFEDPGREADARRPRGRGDVPGVQHDARPVELGGGEADQGLHRAADRGGRLEGADQGQARRRVRAADPGRAAEGGLRPARLAPPARGPRRRGARARCARLALEPSTRAAAAGRPR